MSRKTEYLKSVDEYFHLYNRGVNREPIFFSRSDYADFIDRMVRYLDRSALSLLAFCLMPNHYHLIVWQKVPYAMAEFVKAVCEGYAKRINAWRGRKGHLFQERYKLKHVYDHSYLVSLSRYVHMNPVQAKLVRSPIDWAFSSCREYCSRPSNVLVEAEVILSRMGSPEQYLNSLVEFNTQDAEQAKRFLKHRNRKHQEPGIATTGTIRNRGAEVL